MKSLIELVRSEDETIKREREVNLYALPPKNIESQENVIEVIKLKKGKL